MVVSCFKSDRADGERGRRVTASQGVKQNPVLASNVGRAVLARQGVANPGGSGTNFGWKFEEGKEFYLYTSTDLVSQYDFTRVPQTKGVNFWERIQLNRVFRYKPLHRLPNGGWRFEVRLEGIQSKFENSDLVKEEWSSYSNQKPAERFAGFQQILGATFIYELDKDMRWLPSKCWGSSRSLNNSSACRLYQRKFRTIQLSWRSSVASLRRAFQKGTGYG